VMASKLASEGYVVLAVDLYEGQVATDGDGARSLMSALDQKRAVQNMKAAAAFLRETYSTPKIASLGWCFGGGQSLQFALSDEPLDAHVIYYGHLVADESELSSVEAPVLGIFGDQDASIPVEQVNAFETSLDNLDIENEIFIYEGVGHAFANPSGQNYAPEETVDAWKKTTEFLSTHLS